MKKNSFILPIHPQYLPCHPLVSILFSESRGAAIDAAKYAKMWKRVTADEESDVTYVFEGEYLVHASHGKIDCIIQGCTFLIKLDSIYIREMESV